MRLAFAGTPPFAAKILGALLASEHEVGMIISQPDARRGRGRRVAPTAVAEMARTEGIPLRQPERISEAAGEISAYDALIVAAYGQILRPDTLYAAPHGAWNVHASLLPAYRGAAPIERAIMAGEHTSGVTIINMDEGLDTGPMALQRPTEIPPDMTGGELTERLAQLGGEAIVESMSLLERGSLTLTPQDSLKATYAAKLSAEDQVIRWGGDVREIHDLVRALAPYIGARAIHPDYDGPIKILSARVQDQNIGSLEPGEIYAANGVILVACGVGTLEVLELRAPGGKRLPAADFLRGNTLEGRFLA